MANNISGGKKAALIIIIVLLLAALVYFIAFLILPQKEEEGEPEETVSISMSAAETTAEETTTTEATTVPTETEPPETTTTEPPPLVLREEIKPTLEQNGDTVGWLKLDGTMINSAIVQTEDNDFYLNHSFYKGSSYAGALYADFRCVVNDYSFNQSDNIVIYGHNQADGSMFGTLQYYKVKKNDTSRLDFYLKHPTFTFSNLYEDYTYKIVALFVSEASASQSKEGVIFDAHNYVKFTDGEYSFENFVKNINERTIVNTGVDIEEGDKFITLSTCSNEFDNSRFIVIGRRVRDGESPEVDTSLAEINTDAVEPDLDFIYYGR